MHRRLARQRQPAERARRGHDRRFGGRIGLDLRAGVHTGDIEVRGDDIAGLPVTIAKRVCDLAGSGEVLVSRTVTDLVTGSGIEFTDRGEHELKGVPGTWRVYAVTG